MQPVHQRTAPLSRRAFVTGAAAACAGGLAAAASPAAAPQPERDVPPEDYRIQILKR